MGVKLKLYIKRNFLMVSYYGYFLFYVFVCPVAPMPVVAP